MAQGVAWGARELGFHAPSSCPTLLAHQAGRRRATRRARSFRFRTTSGGRRSPIMVARNFWDVHHPSESAASWPATETIGLEIVEDLTTRHGARPLRRRGLISGSRRRFARARRTRRFRLRVSTSTPLTAALAAGEPVQVERTPRFVTVSVDAACSPRCGQSSAVWWMARSSRPRGCRACRAAARRARGVVPEGAAQRLSPSRSRTRRRPPQVVCVVSGGNIDSKILI